MTEAAGAPGMEHGKEIETSKHLASIHPSGRSSKRPNPTSLFDCCCNPAFEHSIADPATGFETHKASQEEPARASRPHPPTCPRPFAARFLPSRLPRCPALPCLGLRRGATIIRTWCLTIGTDFAPGRSLLRHHLSESIMKRSWNEMRGLFVRSCWAWLGGGPNLGAISFCGFNGSETAKLPCLRLAWMERPG